MRPTALCILRQTRLCCADRLVKLVDAEEGTFQDFVGHQGDSRSIYTACVRATLRALVCVPMLVCMGSDEFIRHCILGRVCARVRVRAALGCVDLQTP